MKTTIKVIRSPSLLFEHFALREIEIALYVAFTIGRDIRDLEVRLCVLMYC